MIVYATPEDYFGYKHRPIPPAGIPADERQALLEVLGPASDDVRSYLAWTQVRFHPSGFPTDPVFAAAVVRATCAQAEWYRSSSETADTTGAEGRFDSFTETQAGVTVGRSRRAGSAGDGGTVADGLVSPRAIQILENAGIRRQPLRRKR